MPPVRKLGGLALDFLFPKTCVGCGEAGELLCSKCRRSLTRLHPPICPKCGRPQASGVLCPSCITWDNAVDGIRAPFRFHGTIREAVHQLKYRNVRILARPLAELMRDYLERHPIPADVIVPVPLHPKRMRERGYNQSELLARELGRLTGLPGFELMVPELSLISDHQHGDVIRLGGCPAEERDFVHNDSNSLFG